MKKKGEDISDPSSQQRKFMEGVTLPEDLSKQQDDPYDGAP
jgi:hypothetical protein